MIPVTLPTLRSASDARQASSKQLTPDNASHVCQTATFAHQLLVARFPQLAQLVPPEPIGMQVQESASHALETARHATLQTSPSALLAGKDSLWSEMSARMSVR